LFKFFLIFLCACCSQAFAETNSIEAINANQQGINVIVKITMKNPVEKSPIGFSITNPARVALDFLETTNGLGKTAIDISMGDVRNVNLVEAAGRSRLVFNLNKPLNFATTIEKNAIIVTIDGSGGVATAVSSIGLPVEVASLPKQKKNIRDIDFRRGV